VFIPTELDPITISYLVKIYRFDDTALACLQVAIDFKQVFNP
jgi:hypothetical protein